MVSTGNRANGIVGEGGSPNAAVAEQVAPSTVYLEQSRLRRSGHAKKFLIQTAIDVGHQAKSIKEGFHSVATVQTLVNIQKEERRNGGEFSINEDDEDEKQVRRKQLLDELEQLEVALKK